MTAPWRHFALHYLEMVVAMLVGMVALDPVWKAGFVAFDAEGTWDRPDVYALVMGLNMVIGMWVWMWIRGHSTAANVEMAVAMYAPFLVLAVPYWLGVLSGDVLIFGGHVLMFVTMLLAMLRRREHYSHHHGFRWSRRRAQTTQETPADARPE